VQDEGQRQIARIRAGVRRLELQSSFLDEADTHGRRRSGATAPHDRQDATTKTSSIHDCRQHSSRHVFATRNRIFKHPRTTPGGFFSSASGPLKPDAELGRNTSAGSPKSEKLKTSRDDGESRPSSTSPKGTCAGAVNALPSPPRGDGFGRSTAEVLYKSRARSGPEEVKGHHQEGIGGRVRPRDLIGPDQTGPRASPELSPASVLDRSIETSRTNSPSMPSR